MDDDDVEVRADRILDETLMLVEDCWLRSGREGMGRRFIAVVEVIRPDGLLEFAFRAQPWDGSAGPVGRDESSIVAVLRMIEGTARRSIPRPSEG